MHPIPNLDKKGFRHFGLLMGVFISGLFGLAFPYFGHRALPVWPWIAACIFWLWALLAPMSLKPVYRVWMRFGLAIGSVINRIILGIVFYVGVLPIGQLMRLVGKDTMARKLDKSVNTYRIPSKHAPQKNMERPF